MSWATARNLAQFISNDQLGEIKNLLEVYSPKALRRIIAQKFQYSSLLFIAVKYRRISIVDYLLRFCNADPNNEGLYNTGSCPCLWLAAAQNDLGIVTLLLKYGADVNCTDVYCRTPLYVASYNNSCPLVRYLVANGADVNKADYKGTTCLMVAFSNPLICRYLINSGADVNRVNNDGKTALMLAVENQNMYGISMLMSYEADFQFINNYGESAAFIAAMESRWDIVAVFKGKGLSADTTKAEVYEIKSCRQVIRKDPTETILLWKEAVSLRNLPIYTPLFQTDNHSILQNRPDWIRNYFDYITGSAIVFLVSRLGLLNPYTLAVLRDAICQTEDPATFAILYRFFFLSLHNADNRLFEKVFIHVQLMTSRFLLEWSNHFNEIQLVFEVFVMQIENLFQRIHSFPPGTRGENLPLVFQIKSYLRLFMDILRKINQNFPKKFADFTEGIKIVVKADNRGPHKSSLLHVCIENEYPISLTRAFLECGANVMRTDEKRKTPLHYALQSYTYRTEETFNMFIEYGFQPEKFKDEYCLSCSLRKKRMLQTPVNYMTLQCLAAEVVSRKQLSYENPLSVSFQNIIYSHFNL